MRRLALAVLLFVVPLGACDSTPTGLGYPITACQPLTRPTSAGPVVMRDSTLCR